MFLLYHAYIYLEFLILACTIYILAPFIIRKDIEKEFKEVIGDRIASICKSHNVSVDYAFQDINDIPGTLPEGRTKPRVFWGLTP